MSISQENQAKTPKKRSAKAKAPVVVNSGAEAGSKLWSMADILRAAGVRPADYQAFILPILMFKVVCDRNAGVMAKTIEEYGSEFWANHGASLAPFVIPPGCSFEEQQEVAANLGEALRSALIDIEKSNAELAGVFLGTDYAELDDERIRELYSVLAKVSFSPLETSQDALGQAYEYLLGKFADAAGAKAGQFFTPVPVAQLLVRLVAPQPGETVYDPTCGSGGLLNAAAEHVAAAGHSRSEVALFGQELDAQSYAIAKVNMFLHGNSGQVAKGDTLLDPKFADDDALRKFSCSVANPPFGLTNTAHGVWDKDRFGRSRWGSVTKKPAELAFVAHIASSLVGLSEEGSALSAETEEAPEIGRAAIVLPMGALFRKGVEAETRKRLLEAGLVDAVVALPENLFFNTSIPASILVLRTKSRHEGKVLFVDASAGFTKIKKQNTLDAAHLAAIENAVKTAADHGDVRTKLVEITDIVAADSELAVSRWLAQTTTMTVDVPAAMQALRAAENASAETTKAFWERMQEAGYVG
jgi:type I restriction enzyme M protein